MSEAQETESGEEQIGPAEANLLWRAGKMACHLMCTLALDLKVYGRQHVPDKGGVLIVSNHQSFLDPVLLAVYLRRTMSYFAKSELFENKFFAKLIRGLHAFPVRQGEGDIGAVREAIKRLKQGYALNLFPEGSRTEDGEMLPIEGGVGLIVRKAGVPVVPAAIHGSFAAWPRGQKFFKPKPVRVQFGPPLHFDGMKAAGIVSTIDTTLRTMFDELRSRNEWSQGRT